MAISTALPKSFTGTLVSKNHRGSAFSVDEDRGDGAFSVDKDRGGGVFSVDEDLGGSACSVDEDCGDGAFSVDEDCGGSACTRARAATGRRGAGLCSAGSLESRVQVLPVHLQGGVRATCCLWSCHLHR